MVTSPWWDPSFDSLGCWGMTTNGDKSSLLLRPRLRRVQKLPHRLLDLVLLGEALALQLGENPAVAEENLEGAGFAGDDGDAAREPIVVVVQDVLRQTGGAG